MNRASEMYAKPDLAKDRAAYHRWRSIENAEKLLLEFESNFQKQGGRVLWAPEASDALKEVGSILEKFDAKNILKSKSTLLEEIGLKDFLKEKQIQWNETDLGDYIQQLSDEKPFHPVTPAMHQSKEHVARLMHSKHNTPPRAQPTVITEAFADYIREESAEAKVAITGANFLIADAGAVALTENEGNISLISAKCKALVVIAGIDKILENASDLDTIWPLLACYGTGEKMTAYNTLISGAAGTAEEGPQEVYLILVDHGRSRLMAEARQRQAATCIGCGACHHVCPVFQMIGGQTYETARSGPIGQVMNPFLLGEKEVLHQTLASPVCGRCNEVCPVNIDLQHLISEARNTINEKNASVQDKYGWISWKKMMLKRKRMNQGNSLKSFMLRTMFRRGWGESREFPEIAERSFNQLWTDIRGAEDDEDKII